MKRANRAYPNPVRTAQVASILSEILVDPSLVPELTNRLNQVLKQFSMIATEEWSRYGFSHWGIARQSPNILVSLWRIFEEDVASVGDDFTWFSVNPDGPISYDDCKKIVAAIEKEFSVQTKMGYQSTYQGGL